MTKHTPGPWHGYADTGNIVFDDRGEADVEPVIATVNYENVSDEQFLADLALITAAPTILAALKVSEVTISGTLTARGYIPGSCTDGWHEVVKAEVVALATVRAAIAKAEKVS